MSTTISTLSVVMATALIILTGCDAAPTPTPSPSPTSDVQPSDGAAGEVPVFREIAVWGQDPDGDVHFSSPNGIAIDSVGNVYVTEFRGHRVQKFTADGTLLLQWGSQGGQEEQFRNPTGISVDRDDNVYVAESGNHRVQKFTADGEWLASWGSQGSDRGQFFSAMVVDVDDLGRVYVSDWGNSRIQVFDSIGNFVDTWGHRGTAEGELMTPTGLHVDRAGNIWVVDRGNNRIQKFTLDGQLLAAWGAEGFDAGQFRVPTSVAVDTEGNIYVAEVENSRVQIFDSEGQFLTELAPGLLQSPHGLAFDGAGNLYVGDTGHDVVRKFAPDASTSAASLIQLQDPLDEPEYYCIDVVGAGPGVQLQSPLQMHTCKPGADDEMFTTNRPLPGHLYMEAYDLCVEADRAQAGSVLNLKACSDSTLQRFVYKADATIRLLHDGVDELCVAAAPGEGTPTGGPSHLRRDLLLQRCAETELALSQWAFPGASPQ